jgi:hypothetical protein
VLGRGVPREDAPNLLFLFLYFKVLDIKVSSWIFLKKPRDLLENTGMEQIS